MRTPLLLALTLLLLPACDGGEENAQATKPAPEAEPSTVTSPAANAEAHEDEPALAAAPVDEAAAPESTDYLEIIANHEPKKASDPAVMRLTSIKVVEAEFNPKKLDGASATFEIALNSLSSKVPDRDEHLKSDDFLDVASFPLVRVTVSEVEAVADGYTAKASVTAKGATANWALNFEAVDVTDTSVRIKGTHEFSRGTFQIGKAGNQADTLTANWDITLDK